MQQFLSELLEISVKNYQGVILRIFPGFNLIFFPGVPSVALAKFSQMPLHPQGSQGKQTGHPHDVADFFSLPVCLMSTLQELFLTVVLGIQPGVYSLTFLVVSFGVTPIQSFSSTHSKRSSRTT